MSEAYDALPEATKIKWAGCSAPRVPEQTPGSTKAPQLPGARNQIAATSVLRPLVRTHPGNGRKAIYLNPIRIEEIVGMDDADALALLDALLAHATQPRFEYRHKWQPGDVVIWDNRCLLHKANGDYPVDEVRYLYRLMLKGERPV